MAERRAKATKNWRGGEKGRIMKATSF